MRLLGIVLVCVALPSLAHARPITAGASVGRIQSKANADGDASDTWQIFGRIGLTTRLSAQLEIQKIEDPSLDIRGGTALLVVELGSSPHFVPLLVAGFGLDHAQTTWYEAKGTHTEGGLGLEYRADGGFVVGADVRLGGRSVNETYQAVPVYDGTIALYSPGTLTEGEYRSARLYAAVRF
jgi:hypothetical protein